MVVIDFAKEFSSAMGRLLKCVRGSQIAEFAIGLPFLMVLLVGIFDFGQVLNTKQKINNSAREGARFASNQTTLDWSSGASAPSIAATRAVIDSYLTSAGLADCGLQNATPSFSSTNMTWTYTVSSSPCQGDATHLMVVVIQRAYQYTITNGGNSVDVISTKVSITYPLQWHFASVMKVLLPGSNYTGPIVTVSSNAVMANMT